MTSTAPLTTDKAPATAGEAQLAKGKEIHDKIIAEHKEREKWMPTPTQEENDRAALGEFVSEKKADGSPVEETPEQQHKRQMEAKKPASGAGYSTRAASAG
jgi:hypothetical protein